MKRRFLSLLLCTVMTASMALTGCGNGNNAAKPSVNTDPDKQGKVLNIYCWNTEFQDRFEYFKKSGKLPSDVKVNFVITPNENNAYQNALDAALLKQKDAAADDKIDMFLIEADYALKYVNSMKEKYVNSLQEFNNILKEYSEYLSNVSGAYSILDETFSSKNINV